MIFIYWYILRVMELFEWLSERSDNHLRGNNNQYNQYGTPKGESFVWFENFLNDENHIHNLQNKEQNDDYNDSPDW